jgi:hypothetical protein
VAKRLLLLAHTSGLPRRWHAWTDRFEIFRGSGMNCRRAHMRLCTDLRHACVTASASLFVRLQITVERCAVEGDHDDFAAVSIIAFLIVLRDIDDGERYRDDVSILKKHARAFHLVPVVDGTVSVANEVSAGVVSEAAEGPVANAVDGG